MPYYERHEGTLFPGKIARSEDIHQIQTNIDEAIRSLIEDQYDHTAFILGSRENDFLISPAPKRLGRYMDNMNAVNESNEIWLDIDNFGYKQAIKTSKTSLYSVIVKLRNLYSQPQDVSFELWSEDNKIAKQTVTVPAKTQNSEFEIIFGLDHFSTQHGRTAEELEKPDADFIMKPGVENHLEKEYARPNNPNNQSIGSTVLYLVVKAIHKATEVVTTAEEVELIDENTFMICADSQGNYGQLLERTADDGRNYESTDYDLFFKSIYSNAPTYLCNGGVAVVHGEPVICNDTHVTVDGASAGGNTKSYICMDAWGQLKSYTSHAYWGDESNAIFDEFPNGDLVIAIIYTYNADTKQPKIVQDDTLIEDLLKKDGFGEHEFGMPIRQRSHHERLRRLEKEMAYHRDVAMPSRLKYNLTGSDIVDEASTADDGGLQVSSLNSQANPQLTISANKKAIDWSKYFIATDKYGNFVIKSIDAETEQIPVTLKETPTTEDKTGIKLAQTIVSTENVTIDRDKGVAELEEHKVEQPKKVDKATSLYGVGLTSKEAKETELNPWDDKAGNRPETADIKPKTHVFTMKKGVNGVHVRSSEYPAMTLYLPEKITLKELAVPVTKFKNVETVQFHIWERQGPNNKHNTVWLEKLIYSSKKFSLKNAKTKDGYQILDEPFKIEIKDGLKMRKHQYIILVQIVPKSGEGSVYVETYKPKDSTDFLIRYHGSADCAHFRLKTRYREVWYTSSQGKNNATIKAYVNEFYKEGRIESGEVVWENSEPIASITPYMNSVIPTGCSIELQANVGNGWKTLTNEKPTTITGGTSSFKWRAILKGDGKHTPQITYDEDKKYAINFTITKQKPRVGTGLQNNELQDKNVLTTKTFYPGDILRKYIGDDNLNTCNKFSNYEWIRIFAENEGNTSALIDIAASDKRMTINPVNSESECPKNNGGVYSSGFCVTTTNSDACPPDVNQYDVFTLYYADLTLADFIQESVDYSNYDNNIEYDEHNLRFKIDTDKAYNDDDVAFITLQDAKTFVEERDESKIIVDGDSQVDNNAPITIDTSQNYITVFFNQFATSQENLYAEDNAFIWKYTLPGDRTLDLSNYSALKIGYNFNSENADDTEATLSGIGLYISSAIEEEAPSNNYDIGQTIDGKEIREYEDMAPETLVSEELERYKNSVLKVTRVVNDVTYIEYYYYEPDENGIWRRHQYHNIQSFTIYELGKFTSALSTNETSNSKYITILIDDQNDNFKYVKEIGLVALTDKDKVSDADKNELNFNALGTSSLQITDIKGVIQGYSTIYSAEKSITMANDSFNKENGHYQTALFKDASDQISSLTRVYYNNLDANGEMIGYINNETITSDANNFAIQFACDTYLPKDSLLIKLCSEKNGVSPVFTLNMPTLNQIYYDPSLQSTQVFNRTEDTNTIKTLSGGTEVNKITEGTYDVSLNDPQIKPPASEAEIVYKMTIEPTNTTLSADQDKLGWNLYRQKVTANGNKEVLGNKELVTEIYPSTGGSTKIKPVFLLKTGDSLYSNTYSATAGENHNDEMYDSEAQRFGVQFDYSPSQYKVKIGFKGYTTGKITATSDTEHNDKTVTYRSAEAEFTVDMYWVIKNTVNFSQIYKKINEEKNIKSVSIHTTNKFQDYMNTIRGTKKTDVLPPSEGIAAPCMHFFIKNMVLHEAEHIPLFHPNVRMKIYSKAADGSDTNVEAVGIRKIGAIIEYK